MVHYPTSTNPYDRINELAVQLADVKPSSDQLKLLGSRLEALSCRRLWWAVLDHHPNDYYCMLREALKEGVPIGEIERLCVGLIAYTERKNE